MFQAYSFNANCPLFYLVPIISLPFAQDLHHHRAPPKLSLEVPRNVMFAMMPFFFLQEDYFCYFFLQLQ